VIQALRISVPDERLADLHRVLRTTRWPDVDGRPDGVAVFRLRTVVHHWLHHYDWRTREGILNTSGCFTTTIDDAAIDFLHVQSPRADALPLLLVHGWPGTVLDFRRLIHALTEPADSDAEDRQPFHVVIPCLPGSGLSGAPPDYAWDLPRLASAWSGLMGRLGYDRWLAHGGGLGARLAAQLGLLRPEGLDAVHLATAEDSDSGWAAPPAKSSHAWDVALMDSPVGIAAWMLEAYAPWIDAESDLGADDVLDGVMLNWLADTTAAGRDWWLLIDEDARGELTVPLGCSQFARRARRPDEIWAGLTCRDLFYWNDIGPVARLPALQQPDVLVAELQRCFASRTW
jgi:epoxide hydrolase